MQAKDLIVSGSSRFLNEINGKIDWSNINNKPSSFTPASHTHGNIQNGGTLQTTDVTIANGDKLVVTDSSDSSKIARTSISFDGSTTTQCLTKKGTWATFASTDTNTTYTLSADTTNEKIILTPSSGSAQSVTVPYASISGYSRHSYVSAATLDQDYPMIFTSTDVTGTGGASVNLSSANTVNYNPVQKSLTVSKSDSNYSILHAQVKYDSITVYDLDSNRSHYHEGYMSSTKIQVTTDAKSLGMSNTDITFTGSTPDTWDGTNTSLKTALANKMTNQVQSAQVGISCLSNNIMMYKCGRIVYFSIIADFNSTGLPSKVTTNVGSITATDWQPISTCDSGLKGHNNQVSMSINSNGTITMYNYTNAALTAGWFRWSCSYITKQ